MSLTANSTLSDSKDAWRTWRDTKLAFLADNRGFLKRVSIALHLTPVYMSEVYWEKKPSRNNHVERYMILKGAPGFDQLRASESAAVAE